ncbi:MAG: UV DNA damage repair endonuclease UvsE [Capsulimonadales bacterium]|nr:UV DNA damage repair endonuclease UvsE [Capsulimonadales bacterium]
MRLGFAVKVLGEGGIKECDTRRWQNNPHLKCSLDHLRQVLDYCHRHHLNMYRMSSDLAPYLTHPDLPQFHRQLEEASEELAAIGDLARRYGIRLSLHPSQYIVLNAHDESIAEKSIRDLIAQGEILDRMGCGPEAVVVTHVGGAYGNKTAGIERFARRFDALPEAARRRLVVENDDVTYSAADALRVHALCGARVVFDNLHFFCNNPERLPLRDTLERCLATWPADQTPKIHYSTPRTESVEMARKSGKAGEMKTYQAAPDLRLHADYVNPFEFRFFLEKAEGLRPFDIMVEAKAKDLAVLKLKNDLAKFGDGRTPSND